MNELEKQLQQMTIFLVKDVIKKHLDEISKIERKCSDIFDQLSLEHILELNLHTEDLIGIEAFLFKYSANEIFESISTTNNTGSSDNILAEMPQKLNPILSCVYQFLVNDIAKSSKDKITKQLLTD